MLMVGTLRFAHPTSAAVIASEAEQSRIFLRGRLDCFVAMLLENDGVCFFTVDVGNDGKNFIDSILARAGDLPVVPICRS
jgi:hypothetical protein